MYAMRGYRLLLLLLIPLLLLTGLLLLHTKIERRRVFSMSVTHSVHGMLMESKVMESKVMAHPIVAEVQTIPPTTSQSLPPLNPLPFKVVTTHRLLYRAFKNDEKKLLVETLLAFDEAMRKLDINYFLYGGTMIGAARHHGQIPWDDDVDVMIPETKDGDRKSWDLQLKKIVKTMGPLYTMNANQYIFKKNGTISVQHYGSIQWPFIDPFHIGNNGTHLGWGNKGFLPMSTFFPVVYRPFEGHWFPTPRKWKQFFQWTYSPNGRRGQDPLQTCCQFSLRHKVWSDLNQKVCLPCNKLLAYDYPFVTSWIRNNNVTIETLTVNGKLIQSVSIRDHI